MSTIIPEDQQRNYELFRDCLSTALLEKISEPATKPRRRKAKPKKKTTVSQASSDEPDADKTAENEDEVAPETTDKPTHAEEEDDAGGDAGGSTLGDDDLADFTEYIATETFVCLPSELKSIDHHDYIASPALQSRYPLPLTGADMSVHLATLSPEITDSLAAYGITPPSSDTPRGAAETFLAPVLTSYLQALATPPPPPSSTRAEACELCGRGWINLSYHHLIPRFVHAKAVRRGWHRACDLQSVAWLCGACHRFVHRFAGHEELARRYYTVELLLEQEEVRRWAEWVGRLRWKGR
ncbi:hypothetical protein F4802DRAFT_617956 [Xylaria palmicola]|nr:hypothetical protein F4802DRAFT_617956 [Xylaria palmicola]